MNANGLIEYLGFCFDAEVSIDYAERMIDLLNTNLTEVQQNRKYHETMYLHSLPCTLVQPVLELEPDKRDTYRYIIDSDKGMLIDDIKYGILGQFDSFEDAIKTKKSIKEHKKLLEQAERDYPALVQRNAARQKQYDIALAKYNADLQAYNQQNQRHLTERRQMLLSSDSDMIVFLTERISEENGKKNQLRTLLDRLYDMGVLHERFRNQMAVYQLKEYLEMGIADTLEGVSGAYRVYLDDLRSAKIVSTIEDFKQMVEQKLDNIIFNQDRALREMKEIRNSLYEINRTIETGIGELKTGMDAISCKISGVSSSLAAMSSSLDASRDEMYRLVKSSQADILHVINTSAYNQYLIDKQDNLHSYLFRMLENPSL